MSTIAKKRNWLKIGLGGLVATPVLGAGGLGLYILFRVRTKPPDHQFQPLVSADGRLQLSNVNIKAPSQLQLLIRVLQLLWIFIPVFVKYVFVSGDVAYEKWCNELLRAVEKAGPAFVKLGQWTTTRRDLFSEQFRKVFSKLYCETSYHSFADSKRIIEEDLKQPITEVFDWLEEGTIGSGSIGQVHKGKLKDRDQLVVVKVMHPNVVENIAKDFFVINSAARLVDKWFKRFEHYNLVALALAWTNHLAAQLDFRIEHEHLDLFNKNFADVDFVRFPRGIRSTQRVLIETFEKGVPAHPEYLQSLDPDTRDILAAKGLNSFCKMLLRDNFIHGDMHPGNILIDVSNPKKPEAVMIDVGLCQKLSAKEAVVYHDLMASFVHWDPQLNCDCILRMSDKQSFCTPHKFIDETKEMFARYRPVSGDEEHVVSNILESQFAVVRDNYVTLDPPYVNLLCSVLVLESFIMALNPEYNMVRNCAPWLVSEGHVSKSTLKKLALAQYDAFTKALGRKVDEWFPSLVPETKPAKKLHVTQVVPTPATSVTPTAAQTA